MELADQDTMEYVIGREERLVGDGADFFEVFDDNVAADTRNPYPELAKARKQHPVQRFDNTRLPNTGGGVFFVYGYDEIMEVLRNGETFSSAHLIDLSVGDVMGKYIILAMDNPEHLRYRSLVSMAFRRKALMRWDNGLIAPIATELIDRFADREHAELVHDFTFPYPAMVIAGLFGLPHKDYELFQRWSIAILSINTTRDRAIAGSEELRHYLATILADRRREPRDDVMSHLAHAELDGERLNDEEIFSFLRLLIPAGVETSYRSTGNLLYCLLSNPDQLEAVRADRSLIPQAIEETLRFEPPVLTITRSATRDVELAGVPIPGGSTLVLMLGAANRDESRWPEPDRYNIFREQRPHLAFGQGPHICLGQHLSRIEMQVTLNLLLDRLPNLRLDPNANDPHIHGHVFRSPTSLPVLFG